MFRSLIICLALGATAATADPAAYLLKPARVFDGVDPKPHEGWGVLVRGDKIEAVGPSVPTPADATVIDLPGETLLPGMIEGHSHLYLHPYNETSWDDQVLREPLSLRTARAVNPARATLLAGIPSTRAIGATGALGPMSADPVFAARGAEEAVGPALVTAVRHQISAGAVWVKLFGDYRGRPGEPSRPTFSLEEMQAAVAAAHSAGRKVAVHAGTPEGMRRA